jgi:pyridoxine 5'-phosphate synthase PdxJ
MNGRRVDPAPRGRLLGATAVYAILVLVAGSAGRSLGPGVAGAAAVLSVLPAVYALVVVMRHVASLDELQRLIHLQAAAFSIGLTVVAGLTAGSLRAFAGLPSIELVWSVPVVAVGWMIGLAVASRRYA